MGDLADLLLLLSFPLGAEEIEGLPEGGLLGTLLGAEETEGLPEGGLLGILLGAEESEGAAVLLPLLLRLLGALAPFGALVPLATLPLFSCRTP